MTNSGTYHIVCSVLAHDGPIRCACIGPSGELVTGCQSDVPNFRRWRKRETENESEDCWEELGEAVLHDHWVTALTSLPPDISREFYAEGCIITGCQDSQIRIFSHECVLLQTLRGHGKGVVSFSFTAANQLVSGSWDGTAKIWDLSSSTCIHTLGSHENGVQVLALANNLIATTSTGESVNGKPANFKLRFWDAVTGMQVGNALQDHQGSIRSITALPAIDGFATTANDGTVIMRTTDGHPIDMMQHPPQGDGGPPFVFGCCALDTDGGMDLVSCGEDGSVIVWCGAELMQSLPHPACVWAVKSLPGSGGDFATCGDDGFLRIFSRNIAKIGSDHIQQLGREFELEVQEAMARRSTGPSAEEIAKAPRWEARGNHPGKSADQVCVFNKDGNLVAAQWISGAWVIVGTVTSTGDGGYLNEVWYDHIMPVELEGPTGVMTLKLGHNNGENAFVAAQRFIDQNHLQQGYLGQIADWITARSGQSMPTLGGGGEAANSVTVSSVAPPALPVQYSCKVIGTLAYDDVPSMAKILEKFIEFNTALSANSDSAGSAVGVADINLMEQITRTLNETSYYHSSTISVEQLTALCRPLLFWSPENLFPLYDILRVLVTHPSGAETLAGPMRSKLQQIVQRTLQILDSATHAPTLLTATRFLCNCAKVEALRNVVYEETWLVSILQSVQRFSTNGSKVLRIAVSRIVWNTSGFATRSGVFARSSLSPTAVAQLCQCIAALLLSERESAEVVLNALCALGTLRVSNCDTGDVGKWRTALVEVQSNWATRLGAGAACLAETMALF